MDLDRAIPMGLILNELVSNSFRHAFMSRNFGKIDVHLGKVEDQFLLIVKDDGPGIDNSVLDGRGMGLTLVKNLVKQLRGTIVFEKRSGAIIEIKFPIVNQNPIHI